jgi:peroxiredoxin Q/BCP
MDTLKAGDVAPNFDLPSDDGQEIKLRDYRAQNVVLYFFPKAMTPG